MKKYFLILIISLLAGTVLIGCSPKAQKFEGDKDLQFKLINHKSISNSEKYIIQIKSKSPMELNHLELYLSYPIKIKNGIKDNPNKIKGHANKALVSLKKEQAVQFTFNAPINEVFGSSNLLDFNDPDIKLMGYIKNGDEEVPFAIGGSLNGFLHN